MSFLYWSTRVGDELSGDVVSESGGRVASEKERKSSAQQGSRGKREDLLVEMQERAGSRLASAGVESHSPQESMSLLRG